MVVAALLLWLPGLLLAARLLPAPRYDALDRLLAAPALSTAAIALATLWSTTLGIPLDRQLAWLGLGSLLAGGATVLLIPPPVRASERRCVEGYAATTRGMRTGRRPRLPAAARVASSAPWPLAGRPAAGGEARLHGALARARVGVLPLAVVGVLVLGLGARLWSTHDLLPALGADTYHHALIARLIVERGGVPDSYAPYAPIASFAYHFGFHSLVAWLHWWTGADLGTLLPLAGHLVNVAVAASVAWWVRRQVGDDRTALLAAWLTALLCVFPAYFVNWGRFTQATGLLLLPVAAVLWADGLRALAAPSGGARGRPVGPLAAAAMTTAGLFLAHYRMAAMLPLLLAVWALVQAASRMAASGWRLDRPAWPGGVVVGGGVAAMATVLLLLPWLVRLAGALGLGLGEQPGEYGAGYYALERLGTAPWQPANWLVLPLAGAGLALATWRRAAGVLALALWGVVQLALANPYWWPLAVAVVGRVDLITVIATLWFPAAVAAAYGLATLGHAAWRRWPRAAPLAAGTLLAGGTLLGAWQLRALLTPDNTLLTEADLAAMAWVRSHVPSDARFAISTVLVPWAPDYAVGIDGGYWLPLLAGRPTTGLPMLYPGERGTEPRAVAEMVAVARALRDAPGSAATARLLRALGVTYVYHSGRPPAPSIEPALTSPHYQVVYDRDGVRILAVRPAAALTSTPLALDASATEEGIATGWRSASAEESGAP